MKNETLTAVMEKRVIRIGRDFVEAVTGKVKSHGTIELKRGTNEPVIYNWVSTQSISVTEHVLRDCATREHQRVTAFKSQAVDDQKNCPTCSGSGIVASTKFTAKPVDDVIKDLTDMIETAKRSSGH